MLKLNSLGDIEWQRTYGGELCDCANAIQITSDGGYVITGCTDSFGTGENNSWILKLNSSGNIEWQRAYGGSDSYVLYSIQQTRDGGYVVAGNVWFSSFPDIWVLKLSSLGDVEWQHTYGGYNIDYARSIQQTNEGGFIVAGRTDLLGSGSNDLLVIKLGPNGDIPSCAIIGSSDVIVTDTSISPSNTNVIPINTDVIPQSTNILPQESDAIVYNLCPGPHTLTLSATAGGTTEPEPGTYTYDGAEDISVRAIADSGNRFVGWTGDASGMRNPLLVIMDSDKSITANFTTTSTGDGKKNGCFIATAAYGSLLHPYVKILRDFKDKYLMSSGVGQALVDL
ncbi:hypothetical protein KA005_38695, partial [bacterium]|nr:hypothetical protein [bacterium]